MFSLPKSFHPTFFNANRFVAIKSITAVLLVSPFLVQAEPKQDANLLKIIAIAESNAAELGSVVADGHWTRIEFSKVYVDPVVVIEPDVNIANNAYVAGIRNIDTKGFEINLKPCDNSTENPLRETINYSVIDNNELPKTIEKYTVIRQPFAWGECAA